jgi:hypothetical protein
MDEDHPFMKLSRVVHRVAVWARVMAEFFLEWLFVFMVVRVVIPGDLPISAWAKVVAALFLTVPVYLYVKKLLDRWL